MYLKHTPSGDLVEVIDLQDVINPHSPTVRARIYCDEVIRRAENILKSELVFPSGESLPLCWSDGAFTATAAA